MRIIIESIPISEMRPEAGPTVGDWFEDPEGNIRIKVADTGVETDYFLVAIHELAEWMLCRVQGVPEKAVDEFDCAFTGEGEPGDEPNAPYRDQHCLATAIERSMCAMLGLSWKEYDDRCNGVLQ